MNTLTAAIVAGDPDAWAILNAHAGRLGGIAAGHGVDPDDALQEMCLKIWRAASRGTVEFEAPGSLVNYGVAAMHSITKDYYRRSRALSRGAEPVGIDHADWEGAVAPDTADLADHIEWRQRFWDILRPYLHGPRECIAIGTIGLQRKNVRSNAFGAGAFKPSQVVEMWPHLFKTEVEVYNVRRNVLGRIRRNAATKKLLEELQEEIA